MIDVNRRLVSDNGQINTTHGVIALPRAMVASTQRNPTDNATYAQIAVCVGATMSMHWDNAAEGVMLILREGGAKVDGARIAEVDAYSSAIMLSQEFHIDGVHKEYLQESMRRMEKPSSRDFPRNGAEVNTSRLSSRTRNHRVHNNRPKPSPDRGEKRKKHAQANRDYYGSSKSLYPEAARHISPMLADDNRNKISTVPANESTIDLIRPEELNDTKAAIRNSNKDMIQAGGLYTRVIDWSIKEEGVIHVDAGTATDHTARRRTADLLANPEKAGNFIQSMVCTGNVVDFLSLLHIYDYYYFNRKQKSKSS